MALSRLVSLFPLKKSTYTPQNSSGMSSSVPPSQVAIFAAGCFWGVEHVFLTQWPINEDKGILKTAVGYIGGRADESNPSYNQVCSGDTNHAEALRIEFDPNKVTYAQLVGSSCYLRTIMIFLPDCVDSQSISIVHMTPRHSITRAQIAALVRLIPHLYSSFDAHIRPEYRSAIFFNTHDQEAVVRRVTEEVQEKHFTPKGQKIVTVIQAAGPWYDAEDYHQEYLFKNPNGYQCPTHKLHW